MPAASISTLWQNLWSFLDKLPAKRALVAALAIWIVYGTVISTIVAIQPTRRSATIEYQRATDNWWGGEKSLYRKKNGYLYLPQFAILYTPYELLPDPVGEPLWRLTCLGLLAGSLWAAANHFTPRRRELIFLIATLLVLPASFSSARNGQVNMPLAGLFLLLAVTLAREKWWTSSILLGLTLIFKPIAIAPILVCGVLFPRLRLPLVATLLAIIALPFLHWNISYAAGEYPAFFKNLTQAGKPTGHTWCDFAGIFRSLGIELPSVLQLGIRGLAGLGTLILSWMALRRFDAARGAFAVLFLNVTYLMLFNPRTETNSYIMLAAFAAVMGAYTGGFLKRIDYAAWWTAVAVILGSENYGYPIFPWTNLWLKALVASAIFVWLARQILSMPKTTSLPYQAATEAA